MAERWLLAVIRNEQFFSLNELNERLAELLEILNDKKMRTYGTSRRELFERLDAPQLLPPASRFQYAEWTQCTVNIDYHVAVDGHFYSVPHELRQGFGPSYLGRRMSSRASAYLVDDPTIFHPNRSTFPEPFSPRRLSFPEPFPSC